MTKNGMKLKAARRKLAKHRTEDGLPRDPNAWVKDDWRDLHNAMEAAKRAIAKRHRKDGGK